MKILRSSVNSLLLLLRARPPLTLMVRQDVDADVRRHDQHVQRNAVTSESTMTSDDHEILEGSLIDAVVRAKPSRRPNEDTELFVRASKGYTPKNAVGDADLAGTGI